MLRLLPAILLLLLSGCSEPAMDPPPVIGAMPEEGLTVMTWNAEFLWDGLDPEDGDPEVDFPWRGDPRAAAAHMAAVANVIRDIDADIVLLQEVEDARALDALNALLGDAGYTAHFVQGNDTFTGQDVALLTRLPPTDVRRTNLRGHSGRERSQVTKNLIATFHLDEGKLALVTAHLLSDPDNPGRRRKREAQADALRRAAVELAEEGYAILLAGDFNDYDPDIPDADARRSPIADTLEILKGMDPATPADDLQNAMATLPQSERRTSHTTAIDHILLSPALYDRLEQVAIPAAAGGASNHLPVVITLRNPEDDAP